MEVVKINGNNELYQEMNSELKMLRILVRETAEAFVLRKEGEIESLLAHLRTVSPAKLKGVANPWLRELRELKLKPAKGRARDLKKIDKLLEELLRQIIELDAGGAEKRGAPGSMGQSRAEKQLADAG